MKPTIEIAAFAVAVLVAALAAHAWLVSRDDQRRLQATLDAQQKIVSDAVVREGSRDSSLASALSQIAKLKAFLSGENVSEPTTMHHQLIPTPQDQLKQMEAKRQADAAKIDDLLDRARHNGINPGALR